MATPPLYAGAPRRSGAGMKKKHAGFTRASRAGFDDGGVPAAEGPAMAHRILIVDDQADLALMMADLLDAAGYATRTAADGTEALAEVQAEPPDLLLLDVHMPGLDGFEVASMLKSDPVTATIPIIMVSAQEGRGSKLIGLESGAEDYLSKPVDPAELIAKIRNLLLLRDRMAHATHH
jgi:DNA-binding response OmpR family regulator